MASISEISRRAFLNKSAGSLGGLALAHLLASTAAAAQIAAKPKARAVICLFQHGGPSQMDLFDPKPALRRWDRTPYPGKLEVHFDKQMGNVLASPFAFHRRGESGLELSELLPHTGRIADRVTLVRS